MSVDGIGATWALICWTAPRGDSVITRYEVLAREVNGSGLVNVTTGDDSDSFNVTGLLPATTYSLSVVAVAEGGGIVARGNESEPSQGTTGLTVPEITCPMPLSEDGIITVSWSYVHTGGLPLTALSVMYSYVDRQTTFTNPVPISDVGSLSGTVSGLVVGFMYTFSVTAENSMGSSTTTCASVLHEIGIPVSPEFESLLTGPGAGEVTLLIKTEYSGVNRATQEFQFVIIPVLDGEELDYRITFDRPNYVSGASESLSVSGLISEQSYTFRATAVNIYGISRPTNSSLVIAGTVKKNSAGIIGGTVGGALAVIIAIVILTAIVFVLSHLNKSDSRSKNIKDEVVYEEPDLHQNLPDEDKHIELKDCPAYETRIRSRESDNTINLEECPAYSIATSKLNSNSHL